MRTQWIWLILLLFTLSTTASYSDDSITQNDGKAVAENNPQSAEPQQAMEPSSAQTSVNDSQSEPQSETQSQTQSQTGETAKSETQTDTPKATETQAESPDIELQGLASDKTHALLYIKDMPTFYQNWQKNPLAKLWENKKIRKRFSKTIRRLEQPRWELYSQRIFGKPSQELWKLFNGQFLLTLPRFEEKQSLSLIANIGKNTNQLEDIFSHQMKYQVKQLGEGEQYIQENEEFLTTTLHSRYQVNEANKVEHFSWTIMDQHLLISGNKTELQNLVAAFSERHLANNWSEMSSYETVISSPTDPDWIAYVNATPIIEELHRNAQEFSIKASSEDDEESQQFLELIQKTGLESIYLAGKHKDNQTIIDNSVFYQDSSWLMNLFKHQSSELVWPDFLKNNALKASTSSVDLGQIWKNILNLPDKSSLFEQIIPMIQMQLQSYSQTSGVDLESALADGFGQQLFYAHYPLADSQANKDKQSESENNASNETDELTKGNDLYVMKLKDPQTVEMAINGLKKAFLMNELFSSKKYLDNQIFYYSPSDNKNVYQADDLIVYAISNEQLFYSDSLAVMENALEQLRYKKTENTIGNMEKIQTVMDNLPSDAIDVSYYQGAYFTQTLVGLLDLTQTYSDESQKKYSCGGSSNRELEEQQEKEYKDINLYRGYVDSVITTQHQADNFYRMHLYLNH